MSATFDIGRGAAHDSRPLIVGLSGHAERGLLQRACPPHALAAAEGFGTPTRPFAARVFDLPIYTVDRHGGISGMGRRIRTATDGRTRAATET